MLLGRVVEFDWLTSTLALVPSFFFCLLSLQLVTLGGVLSSWQQALQRMVVGDIWEVYTPGAHAYGPFGVQRDDIGPNETLVFKLKLLEIHCDNPDDLVPKSYHHPKRVPTQKEEL